MELPKNANILCSMVNMKLRDRCECLSELCEEEDIDKEELMKKLLEAGYCYDEAGNCFR